MATVLQRAFPFLGWKGRVDRTTLRADLLAGLVSALVVLPQGVAYATLAGLPAQYGLYCAILPAIVAALWGSSWHQISGPTNAISLVVFATMATLATPGSAGYIELVLTLALIIGIAQLAMGLAGLGALVNFISHTVVVGFTAGAGLLIIAAQLRNFFGVPIAPGSMFFGAWRDFLTQLDRIEPWQCAAGAFTLAVAVASRRLLPRLPYMVVAMLAGSLFGVALALVAGVKIPTVGALPSGLPPLSLPSFDPETWRKLLPPALAITVLALTEAVSIARAIATKSGQRIDGNQEFIGQGLSNIVAAFTSGYPSSGSFNRSGVNYEAGAKTPLAAVFSALLLLAILLAVAPLATYLPLAVMAALLFVVARGLIDVPEMRRIVRASRGDAVVLAVTFVATLALQLEFAIFVGVLASLLVYLNRTTHPHLTPMLPVDTPAGRRFVETGGAHGDGCPQLLLCRVDGSLFFGAIEHVRDAIAAAWAGAPGARHLVLVGSGINFIDVTGAELLVSEAREAERTGRRLYVCNLKPAVRDVLERSGIAVLLGEDRIFATKEAAIAAIHRRLDAATCARCTVRTFVECRAPAALPAVSAAARSP